MIYLIGGTSDKKNRIAFLSRPPRRRGREALVSSPSVPRKEDRLRTSNGQRRREQLFNLGATEGINDAHGGIRRLDGRKQCPSEGEKPVHLPRARRGCAHVSHRETHAALGVFYEPIPTRRVANSRSRGTRRGEGGGTLPGKKRPERWRVTYEKK